MLKTIKIFAIAMVVAGSASTAFAAPRHDYSQDQQIQSIDASANTSTDRNSMVEEIGN
jgi:hypothetical protein